MSEMFSEYFQSGRLVPRAVENLDPVADDVMEHFRGQEYETSGTRTADGGWLISVRRGDWFRTLLGLKTALNIRIDPHPNGTYVSAGIGIFELQIIPTFVSVFVFAPVILTQIWGIVQQNQLDEDAVRYVEDRLAFYGGRETFYDSVAPETTGGAARPVEDPARTAAERELDGGSVTAAPGSSAGAGI